MTESTIPAFHALLIGIDDYRSPRVPDLGGCVNDVEAMKQLLTDVFGFDADHIHALTNDQATHQAIKAAFRHHLIEPARAWAEGGRPDPAPAFLFHYSGHGSQALDETGLEPDGLDETLVPHDSRTAGVYDIKDWELGQLLDELTQHSDNVTVILDCCHSGSGTKDVNIGADETDVVPVRRIDPDLRPQPAHTQRPRTRAASTRSVTASGWEAGEQYVLLAGCRDYELANEYRVRQGDRIRQHGATSYFLIKELSAMSSASALTYRELHERVRYQVNSLYPQQMPQCEGDRDRLVFGGLRPQRDAWLTVVDKSEGYFWIDGGMAHGLTQGTLLHAYPPETRTLADVDAPLATLSVEEVGAVRSGCVVESGESDVPVLARAVVHRINHGDMRRSVALRIADPALLGRVRALLTDAAVQPYVQLMENGAEGAAPLRVVETDGVIEVQDATGKRLIAPFPPEKLGELPGDMTHLVRYHNALQLENTARHSELAGGVSLAIKQLAFDPNTQEPIAVPIAPTAGGETVIEIGDRVVFEVTNHTDKPLYFALFDFAHDWSVIQLYPSRAGAHEALAPGQTYSLGLSRRTAEQLQPGLPRQIAEAVETIKVIATVDDADFEILQQPALKAAYATRGALARGGQDAPSALSQLMAQAMAGGGTRAFGPPPAAAEDEWTTVQQQVRITQPVASRDGSTALRSDAPAEPPAYRIKLEAPAGFQGQVRVLTPHQRTRSAGGDAALLTPPAGLAAHPEQFRPFPIAASDDAAPAGTEIEIEADAASRAAVTAATPLTMYLPDALQEDEGVLALAFDGNFFYPVGRSAGAAGAVRVDWLPDPNGTADGTADGAASDGEEPAGPDLQPRQRDLGRALKLYLYKVVGWQAASLGVQRARFLPDSEPLAPDVRPADRQEETPDGTVYYWHADKQEFGAGERVLLIIHGFTSHSANLLPAIQGFLAVGGQHYDHVLAFDYETFGTAIDENGQILANALRNLGFGETDDRHLDIIAHSMGALVARSMVEMWGGDHFVDRCFLCGPPNQGTRLAAARKLVPWLSTLAVNGVANIPPAAAAAWVLNKVAEDGAGGEDLQPDSDFLQQLNGSNEAARVPYFVLAGTNEISADAADFWQRLWRQLERGVDAGLDALFQDQNDLVIDVPSMLTVRNGNYRADLLHTRVVGCNHFEYFRLNEPQTQLLTWLRGG